MDRDSRRSREKGQGERFAYIEAGGGGEVAAAVGRACLAACECQEKEGMASFSLPRRGGQRRDSCRRCCRAGGAGYQSAPPSSRSLSLALDLLDQLASLSVLRRLSQFLRSRTLSL